VSGRGLRAESARDSLLAALALAALLALVFAGALSADRVFFQRDIQAYWYPQFDSLARSIAEGSWPVWNPYIGFGAPMLAEPGYQVFYPFAWLNLLLPPEVYYKLYVFAHALLAGMGARRLALRAGGAPPAAWLVGALYVLSGPFLSLVSLWHHLAGAAWLPWVLLAFDRALRERSRRAVLDLGLVAALQALAGSADMCLMSGLLAAAQLVLRALHAPSRKTAAVVQGAALALGGAVTAFALAAAQWLPTLSLIGSTTRAAMGDASRMYWSLHPLLALETVFGGLTALPLSDAFRQVALEGREPFLTSIYLGAGTVVLAALGATGVGGRRARAWLCGAALLVLAALGRFAPVYPLLLAAPGAGLMRFPVKYLVPAALLLALAAGSGLQRLLERSSERGRMAGPLSAALVVSGIALAGLLLLQQPWFRDWLLEPGSSGVSEAVDLASRTLVRSAAVAVVAAVALALALWRPRLGGAAAVFVAVLVLGDLAAAGRGVNPLAPAALLRHRPPLVDRLEPTRDAERIHVIGYSSAWLLGQLSRGPVHWEAEARWALGLQELLMPPIGARWELRGSYDGDFTGLSSPAAAALGGLLARHPDDAVGRRLLEIGNVGHVVGLQPEAYGGLPEVASQASVFTLPIRLFEVPERLPRAYVVGRARRADPPQSFVAVADPSFDPRSEVVLPTSAPISPPARSFSGRARLVASRMDFVSVEAELSSDGYLVLVEAFDPGWRASVDGTAAAVLPANGLFRAVAVPAGKHTVSLRYRPPAVLVGVALSALAWLGLAVARLPLRRRSRAAAP